MEQNISVAEASRILGVSKVSVLNFIYEGKLKELGRIGGAIVLDRHQVEGLAATRKGR